MRRRVSRKLPLEWVKVTVAMATKATVYTGTFDLDLLQNEIAEIWHIDSRVAFTVAAAAGVADISEAAMYLSMDPNADKTPATKANLDDLEIFFDQAMMVLTVVEATSTSVQRDSNEQLKQWRAIDGKPILVGTNVGVVGEYNTSADMFTAAILEARIHFSRRTASASDLNQILLKRR